MFSIKGSIEGGEIDLNSKLEKKKTLFKCRRPTTPNLFNKITEP